MTQLKCELLGDIRKARLCSNTIIHVAGPPASSIVFDYCFSTENKGEKCLCKYNLKVLHCFCSAFQEESKSPQNTLPSSPVQLTGDSEVLCGGGRSRESMLQRLNIPTVHSLLGASYYP